MAQSRIKEKKQYNDILFSLIIFHLLSLISLLFNNVYKFITITCK